MESNYKLLGHQSESAVSFRQAKSSKSSKLWGLLGHCTCVVVKSAVSFRQAKSSKSSKLWGLLGHFTCVVVESAVSFNQAKSSKSSKLWVFCSIIPAWQSSLQLVFVKPNQENQANQGNQANFGVFWGSIPVWQQSQPPPPTLHSTPQLAWKYKY